MSRFNKNKKTQYRYIEKVAVTGSPFLKKKRNMDDDDNDDDDDDDDDDDEIILTVF